MKCDSCGTEDQEDFGADHKTCLECKILKKGIENQGLYKQERIDYIFMLELRRKNVKENAERLKCDQ